MAIPSAVSDLLQTQQIDFRELGSETEATPRAHAHATVFQAEDDRFLVISPSDCLIDIGALLRAAGRELRALENNELQELCLQQEFNTVPALPGVLELPLIIDELLLDKPEVLASSGARNELIAVRGDVFTSAVQSGQAQSASFSIPVNTIPLSDDSSGDQAQISEAVNRFTTRRIKQRLEDTLEFPPLPEIAHRIIQLSANPDADIKDLSDLVEIDASLSSQIVSWAASPYYAAPGEIKSVHDAIVRVLGFDLVMNLALGLALGKTLQVPRSGDTGYHKYWLESVYCAALVELLIKKMPAHSRPPGGLAYLAGLLHNFGFLIMAELFKPQLDLCIKYIRGNRHAGYAVCEQFLLGITRDQLAAFLFEYWQLPPGVCAAVRFQSAAEYDGEHEMLVNTLCLARSLLSEYGLTENTVSGVSAHALAKLGLDQSQVDAAMASLMAAEPDIREIADKFST